MTSQTNSRLAGFAFLFYIVTGISSLVLFGGAVKGEDTAAKLANLATHSTIAGVEVLLTFAQAACAVILAVTLYALTRDQDRELAMMGMCSRLIEGTINALSIIRGLGLFYLATKTAAASSDDAAAANALAGFLFKSGGWTAGISATCFAVGSTIFSWVFLKARSIPAWLSWLGVVSSGLLVVVLPGNLAGFFHSPVTDVVWLPILVFELSFAVWLLVKGVKPKAHPPVVSLEGLPAGH